MNYCFVLATANNAVKKPVVKRCRPASFNLRNGVGNSLTDATTGAKRRRRIEDTTGANLSPNCRSVLIHKDLLSFGGGEGHRRERGNPLQDRLGREVCSMRSLDLRTGGGAEIKRDLSAKEVLNNIVKVLRNRDVICGIMFSSSLKKFLESIEWTHSIPCLWYSEGVSAGDTGVWIIDLEHCLCRWHQTLPPMRPYSQH